MEFFQMLRRKERMEMIPIALVSGSDGSCFWISRIFLSQLLLRYANSTGDRFWGSGGWVGRMFVSKSGRQMSVEPHGTRRC